MDVATNMPWIVALIIGCLSGLTTFLNMRMTKKLVTAQIKASKEIAQLDFNKIVISGNRQEWINSLRENLSQYLAKLDIIFSSQKIPDSESRQLTEEILFLETKISLMLNPDEQKSQNLMKSLNILTEHLKGSSITQPKEVLQSKITEIAGTILKEEWIRVKSGK